MHLAYLHYLSLGETALQHVEQFAHSARGLGHRVDVHAIKEPEGAAQAQVAREEEGERRPPGLLRRYLRQPRVLFDNFGYLGREARLIGEERPDVLLVRDNLLLASCVWSARRFDLPLVVEVNAPVVEATLFHREYAQLPWLPKWVEGWKLRRSDGVVVVSDRLRQHLVELYGLSAEKISVAPNGADLDRFHPGLTPDAEITARFGSLPTIGFVGSFEAWHGIDLLAEMVLAVARERPEVRFVFVGTGPDLSSFRHTTREFEERMLFTGRVAHDAVPALVATFDVGVIAETGYYMSPLKLFEWMAAGKAVVAPRYEPLSQIIEDGADGVLFTPRDAEALVEAVLQLVDDPERRAALGQAATTKAAASFTWTRNAEKVLARCQLALDARRGRGKTPASRDR